MGSIAMQEIARTNQNPKDEWRREAPPLIFWVLCPKQSLHCYKSIDFKVDLESIDFNARFTAESNSLNVTGLLI
jgi:hypothetical protein